MLKLRYLILVAVLVLSLADEGIYGLRTTSRNLIKRNIIAPPHDHYSYGGEGKVPVDSVPFPNTSYHPSPSHEQTKEDPHYHAPVYPVPKKDPVYAVPKKEPVSTIPKEPRKKNDPSYTEPPKSVPEYHAPGTIVPSPKKEDPNYAGPHKKDPVYTEPKKDPVYTEPKKDPVYTEPKKDPVYTEPKKDPVYTEPKKDPVYTEPKKDPEYHNTPGYAKPPNSGSSGYSRSPSGPKYEVHPVPIKDPKYVAPPKKESSQYGSSPDPSGSY